MCTPSVLNTPQTESPTWKLLIIPVVGCKVRMDNVDEPFSYVICTANNASWSGCSMQQSWRSPWSRDVIWLMSLREYMPESMPYWLQPETPSATAKTFLEVKMASSPPFQAFSG